VFKPRVTSDLPIGFIAHAEDYARWNSAVRKITMKHGRALPAYWFEYQEISRQ
jgi:hypothetical protein